jgi:hypothetical protein
VRAFRRALLVALLPAACARVEGPPGGAPPQRPLGIVATVPEDLSTIEPTSDPVVFRFERTVSERGVSTASALVSPFTGAVRVERAGEEVRVFVEGGWRAGLVYHVVLLPGVTDRHGNRRLTPAELVFSTGPPIPPTAIAGFVIDRITGRPATNRVVILASSRADSTSYRTVTDSAGFYALQNLPTGTYGLSAFLDQNENREREPNEPASAGVAVTLNRDTDTIPQTLTLVPADTSPPRLQQAVVRDSLQVVITTDDYLDPAADLSLVELSLLQVPDSVAVPGGQLMTLDSLRALRTPADSAVRAPPRQPGLPPDFVPPYREIVLVPGAPLRPGSRYSVTVGGLLNISGRYGGAGTVEFAVPARPQRPDTTACHR